MGIGIPEFFVILFSLSAFTAPLLFAIWAFITINQIRTTQAEMLHKLENIENIMNQVSVDQNGQEHG